MNMQANYRILLVDNNQKHIRIVLDTFEDYPEYNVIVAKSAMEAHEHIICKKPDLILSEWKLPDGTGLDIINYLDIKNHIHVIIMTAFGNEELAVKVMKSGAMDYIVKSKENFAIIPILINRSLKAWEDIRSKREIEFDNNRKSKILQTMLDAVVDVMCVISENMEILDINQAGVNTIGLKKEAIIGKKCNELNSSHPNSLCTFLCSLANKCLKEKENYQFFGNSYNLNSYPIIDENDQTSCFLHIIKDNSITDNRNNLFPEIKYNKVYSIDKQKEFDDSPFFNFKVKTDYLFN
jgi:CheY-like chemotaxis protein